MYYPKFHLLVQSLLTSSTNHGMMIPPLSQFSNLILLLGLTSVVLDVLLRRQDPFYDTGRALARVGAVLPIIHSRLMSGPPGRIKIHGRVVYHMAAIALSTPLEDLERATNNGFSRSGRTPQQHARAAIIRLLTKHKVGPEPARHAVQLLRLSLLPLQQLDVATTQAGGVVYAGGYSISSTTTAGCSPFETSSLYYGVLALWAYIMSRVGDFENAGAMPMTQNDSFMPPEMSMHHPLQAAASPYSTDHSSIASILSSLEAAIDQQNSLACRTCWRAIMPHVLAVLGQRPNSNAQEYRQVLGCLSDSVSL